MIILKRTVLILLCTALLLTLSACGGKTPSSAPETDPEPEKVSAEPDDYIGTYTNDGFDYVVIAKNGNDYIMEVSLYRLTTIDEGTVSFTDEGVIFNALDANGEPVVLSFFKAGDDSYTLRVDKTTWTYFEPGMVWEHLIKTE